jgi:hypothetical protein
MKGTSTRPADETVQNQIYEALTHPYRRSVLQALSTTPLTIDKLVSQVVRDLDAHNGADERLQVLISLYHVHLPKLEEANLIEWNGQSVSISNRIQETSLSVDISPHGFDIDISIQ